MVLSGGTHCDYLSVPRSTQHQVCRRRCGVHCPGEFARGRRSPNFCNHRKSRGYAYLPPPTVVYRFEFSFQSPSSVDMFYAPLQSPISILFRSRLPLLSSLFSLLLLRLELGGAGSIFHAGWSPRYHHDPTSQRRAGTLRGGA